MATKQYSSRSFTINSADNGTIGDLGPGATNNAVGTFTIQFIPDESFEGSFTVLGRVFGVAAQAADAQFASIPYRRINVDGVASDYALGTAAITGAGIIQVPCNGMAVGLLMACTAGSCAVVSWNMNGSSAV